MQEPINEIKVSISQLWCNNSEGRRLEAERTSAKFISSGPGVLRPGRTSLFHPEPLNKASARLILFSVGYLFWIDSFLCWFYFESHLFIYIYVPAPSNAGMYFFLPQFGFRDFYNLVIKIFDRLLKLHLIEFNGEMNFNFI